MSLRKIVANEITITVQDQGAELVSLKNTTTGREYMWDANPEYWGKTSPILFPFVGGLKNNSYRYQGKEFQMSKHGFAREMEFTLISQDDNSMWFELASNEETMKKYPFAFKLLQGYEVLNGAVKVLWKVYNKNEETMYFSLGGHPAFACPLDSSQKQTDCYIRFDLEQNEVVSTQITPAGLSGSVKTSYPLVNGMMKITEDLFDDDALVIENNQTKTVELADPDGNSYLRVSFDAPLFGIWSPAKIQAPFICIEPWYGRCDAVDFEGSLEDREWGNRLLPGEVFEAEYTIEIL